MQKYSQVTNIIFIAREADIIIDNSNHPSVNTYIYNYYCWFDTIINNNNHPSVNIYIHTHTHFFLGGNHSSHQCKADMKKQLSV